MNGGPIGHSLRRLEDRRFLVGQGRYVDDVDMRGQLHGVVLRSPYGHALIEGIDAADARAMPGVRGVFTRQISTTTASGHCRALPRSRAWRRSSCRPGGRWRATGCVMAATRWRSSSPTRETRRATPPSVVGVRLSEVEEGRLRTQVRIVFRYVDHQIDRGPAFHQLACQHGLEGIVSKRVDGRYEPDRRSWLKIKCLNREEFVVVGWSDPEGSRHRIGALLLGYYTPDGKLTYAGRVGTGISERELERL
jgi:hypothetical protein